jgi:hypothetical protein
LFLFFYRSIWMCCKDYWYNPESLTGSSVRPNSL